MIIIGITGPIGHGKTAFGQALQRQEPQSVHFESFQVITSLAEQWLAMAPVLPKSNDIVAINNWLQMLVPALNSQFDVNCTFMDVLLKHDEITRHPDRYQRLFDFLDQPKAAYTSITEENKEYFRPLLQWMGGYFVLKVDFGIWYKYILRQIQMSETKGVVLATVGGLRFPEDANILKEAGAIIVDIERPGEAVAHLDDPTERQRQTILTDSTIVNNGSLADLELCAAHLYADVKAGQVKPTYQAI
jgi:uncharacterized protein (DUF1778 family)